jgi:hypothetical protein
MKMPWKNLEGPAKLLIICVVIFLVSAGLCGLQLSFAGVLYERNDGLTGFIVVLGIIEVLAIAGSLLVGIIALHLWLTGGAMGLGRGDDPQTLFPRDDSKDGDKQP